MTPSFFAALIALAGAVPLGAAARAFHNFVDCGRYGRALLTLSAMVAALVLIAPR